MSLLIGLGLGLAGAVGKMFGRKKSNKDLKSLMSSDPSYKENPLAMQRLGFAKTLLNARMPGAISAEKNILSDSATRFNNVQRNASSGAQAIAAAAGIGGQTDQSLVNLGITETQDYQNRLNNLYRAEQGVIEEGDKVYGDNVRKFGNKAQIMGAINENRQNTWGDISNIGFRLMDFGAAGGFGNLFKKRVGPAGNYQTAVTDRLGDRIRYGSGYTRPGSLSSMLRG